MKRLGTILLATILISACTDENYLRLPSNEASKTFLPDYSKAKSFRSNEGDTIMIEKKSSSNYYEKTGESGGSNGALGGYDYIEVERTNLELGCDDPYLRFKMSVVTSYSENQPTKSEDLLSVQMDEGNMANVTHMNFVYTDTLSCTGERCAFSDTFKFQTKTYYNVYFQERNAGVIPTLYLNEKGLVGFKTTDNKVYELISN